MTGEQLRRVPFSFWLIGVPALVWNGLGAVNFLVQMNTDTLAAYRASERAIIEGRPVWATAGFALAVLGGTLGSLALLLRRAVVFAFFIASLAGAVLAAGHALGAGAAFGLGEIIGIVLLPVIVAAFLLWYSWWTRARGWLK